MSTMMLLTLMSLCTTPREWQCSSASTSCEMHVAVAASVRHRSCSAQSWCVYASTLDE